MPLSQQQLDDAFTTLVGFAARGERCPENGTHGLAHDVVPALARAGRIRIHLYAHNYRAVEILEGQHKGAMTAPHPNPKIKPWRVIGTEDTRRPKGAGTVGRPSAPRALSSTELSKL